MKKKTLISAAFGAALLFSACAQGVAAGAGAHGSVVPAASTLGRFQPREDGWQNDPANQPHPSDPNPLRRALGDSPIYHKLFGKPATATYLGCVKQRSGSQCDALQQDLLQKVHAAGFTDATADDAFDPHIVH
ncbi:MAG: hypothetical protein JWR07_1794 [Nevskia sp.]|nr:hypothetical protein [Nevskia sp.]